MNSHMEIYYTDASTGWVAVKVNEEGDHLGEGMYEFHRGEAIESAKRAEPNLEIQVFKKSGPINYTIAAAE